MAVSVDTVYKTVLYILNKEQIEILKQLDLRILHSPNDPLDQTPDEFFKNLDEDKNGE